ncbi:MAG: GntR family transcriptional regulator [Zetaproteobacteria bacterium CG_4_9_14_3_um_filter_49_83]|nr:MAG: GntR family transcriptional regulator [Zetaproteobacteria bacterium CG1_02_49_23]PIQ31020.1 MAG: GntR family transcriptional regulator [Zetaproteobacteria bacterium CG17_big_fil_post_rev_8_21_14_2_50_50_13]PIV30952.1 MAG: GntR family transcriptional regulator [Zetaproteobacteria bacterium CG02_land_8_20_14_3_00_50_9]PIY56929.1 MAG: GntR family transcriptional regulator [Zetaproteobacteria bacterium CG_4_10_14_0_8_um_filter_49_80]PJA35881.1 MAG: GntR family transcriptional regulator [Zet
MIELGNINALKVVKEVDFGLYLDGGDAGEILLPTRYVPRHYTIGEPLDVFIYCDSEDRLIATTEKPYAMVGDFACLKVVSVSKTGAFLDWGLSKDLLLPYSEQIHRMEEGKRYVVVVFVDEQSNRIAASAKLDDFLYEENEGTYVAGEAVSLFVANKTELGYKVIINHGHWGLLHHQEAVRDLKRGEVIEGFIKGIRPDDKIDVCMRLRPSEKTDYVAEMIVDALGHAGGFLPLTDKSSADEIHARFGISKSTFKKAIGALYRKRVILLERDGLRLMDKQDS